MESNQQPQTQNQLATLFGKFQLRRSARSTTQQDEVEGSEIVDPPVSPLTNQGRYAQPEVVVSNLAIAKSTDDSLFSDVLAPISKLNLPRVNVDPWSAFWAVLAAMVGGTGITSYLLLIAVPPTPNCQGILPISTDSERLYCAQVGAETKEVPKLRAAVDLVKGWTDRHPLYGESQRLLKSWSEDLMRIGRKQVNEGHIEQAIATIKIVPFTSPVYDRAQTSLSQWSLQAQDSAKIDGRFEQAMKTGDWNKAFEILQSVQRMRGSYWNSYKH
jgi:hypothetical protein